MTTIDTPRRTILKGVGAGLALAVLGTGAATADDDTDDQGDGTTAEVRVGHLSPDAPSVDVYVDGTEVVSDLAYGDFAPGALTGAYLDLPAGEYDITTKVADTDQTVDALSASEFPVEANRNYTVLATGELTPETSGEAELGLLPLVDNDDDETALPSADAGLVRLVHASPDAGAVDLVVESDGEEVTTVSDVEFGQETGYLELPPGEYVVDVGPGAISVPLTLYAGTKVSAYVVGNATTDGEDDEGIAAIRSLEALNPALGRGPDDTPSGGPTAGAGAGKRDDDEDADH